MKKAIVFSTISGQTEKLAKVILDKVGEVDYYGVPSEEALNADVIYVGCWTQAFTCPPNIKDFLEKLNGKKVFLFMTAGYNSSDIYFAPIMQSVKANINTTNEIIGEFICQGAVSPQKQEAIKKMDIEKYNNMKEQLDLSQMHPDAGDIEKLIEKIK
ncbi:MAG: flavodoxin family protein [Clostridia bacterium]